MILDYNNTPALHYWHENVAAYKEDWESIGEVRNFFVSQSLARERRLISGCHWVSRKYVSVFAGDPGYVIAYIPAIFFKPWAW